MIKLARRLDENLLESLKQNHYSRRIKVNFQAYGCRYDFCRFYIIKDAGKNLAVINQFNSTMVISTFEGVTLTDFNLGELETLIEMNKPQTVEMEAGFAKRLVSKLEDYTPCDRTEFEYVSKNHSPAMTVNECPRLDDVFAVLKTSFPAVAEGYDLWLTDTSHKVRRGLSQCLMLENYTTATIQYICDKVALVGHVATVPEERGRFHARKLLYWIGEKLDKEGFTVKLFARSHRVSYYEEIGFKEGEKDIVFERKNSDE